ncbi:cytochrome C oxidase subunit IV family protein [Zhongshania aliphaticivorans]|uniref:cytochrome C oxidase subunit IV family protein n=1 Tax=Zhongshania aliphaticivorans TaxID=1470434 RepID=UPI0012E55680|nr:cytochrome C oxidase subunit IV family protein [Zhongshania aliphaticivorans]CAA0101496.1 Uncharacterised protein [Zhongshania aliphaticivorans]
MQNLLNDKATHIWLLLMGLSLSSWILSMQSSRATGFVSIAIILVISLFKARLVLRNFMDVAEAPAWLRYSVDAWVLTVFIGLLAFFS